MKKFTTEEISAFLNGRDPMERIVNIECSYSDEKVSIIYVNKEGKKMIKFDDFKPFVWAKNSIAVRMFDGNREELKKRMAEYGISVKALKTNNNGEESSERLENGYKYMFYAKRPMSFQQFLMFFQMAKTPIYDTKKKKDINEKTISSREFLSISPVEQYMISTGKRFFKGYNNYDEVKRLQFDLETQGLNPEIHAIDQIGIRTNKGFERIITIVGEGQERRDNELQAIMEFLEVLSKEKPDVIIGHNSENFDWNFIIVRCQKLGTTLEDLSLQFFRHPIYKKNKEAVLKLGGEVEYYKPTIMWGTSIVDSLHAVRRAQAIDSSMKLASLKYVTKYLRLTKPNRVYVPGNQISTIWGDSQNDYAFNDENGEWYKITETYPLKDNFTIKSGRYIVERYLLDDIWETDKIELKLNESNFLINKILPTTFQRACTMGTAGIWKLITLAWCYENTLAVPAYGSPKRFTGGLSRLLKVGYADRVVKLDYNSLYPSIDLSWNVASKLDISNALLMMLEYVLSEREKYKELKGDAGSKAKKIKKQLESAEGLSKDEITKLKEEQAYWEAESSANDKKQLPLKILANSFFGSFGAPDVFPFGDVICAEMTTCIGRQCLRLMISHFTNIGYTPIVGDTDGFNFQMPLEFRYTDENPYIGKGLGRNVENGKTYVGVFADVAEFEDIYLNKPFNGGINKMGLGVDEFCDATINFSRKNYADLLDNGKTKKVGNTIKSRRMSGYIENFLDEGIDLLLHGNGQKFLENYYSYIDKIFNYQIPLRDIASKGKIKKTIEQYKKDCNSVTKSGSKKSRQAWYELVMLENMKVDLNDTIYYVNTGSKKSETDVKRITHQYVKLNGEEVELDNKTKKELLKSILGSDVEIKLLSSKYIKELIQPYITREEDEIILNCKIVPQEIIDAPEGVLCTDEIEYNVVKYIDQFNKRIKPLLVCFSPEIRNSILIQNPDERQYFTSEQCKLVSGFPNKETEQDTYEQLMTLERKELDFWLSIGQKPPFADECHMDWNKIVSDYKELIEMEQNVIFQEENELYLKELEKLTEEDIEKFEEDGTIPSSLLKIVQLNSDMYFKFVKLPNMSPTTGGYIFDDLVIKDKSELEFETAISSDI